MNDKERERENAVVSQSQQGTRSCTAAGQDRTVGRRSVYGGGTVRPNTDSLVSHNATPAVQLVRTVCPPRGELYKQREQERYNRPRAPLLGYLEKRAQVLHYTLCTSLHTPLPAVAVVAVAPERALCCICHPSIHTHQHPNATNVIKHRSAS